MDAFVHAARSRSIQIRMFCFMLAFTGCRISEALSLTRDSIDFEARHVIIRSLKKRGKRVFRAIPIPPDYLDALRRWLQRPGCSTLQLWPWSRMTGYRRVCEVMHSANIVGSYATPKGLRHAFGVRAIHAGVPLTLVQKWLGHADISTTAIYTNVVGPEEQDIASRMWRTDMLAGHSDRLDGTDASADVPAPVVTNAVHAATPAPRNRPENPVALALKSIFSFWCLMLAFARLTAIFWLKRIFYCPMLQNWVKCSRHYLYFSYT